MILINIGNLNKFHHHRVSKWRDDGKDIRHIPRVNEGTWCSLWQHRDTPLKTGSYFLIYKCNRDTCMKWENQITKNDDVNPFKDMGFIKFWIVSTVFWLSFPASLVFCFLLNYTSTFKTSSLHMCLTIKELYLPMNVMCGRNIRKLLCIILSCKRDVML